MVLTLQTLIADTKRYHGEHETRGRTSDSYVLRYINDSWEHLAGKILSLRDDFFSTYYDLALTGALEYNLPIGTNRLFSVEDITGGATSPVDTDPVRYEQRFSFFSSRHTGVKWYIRGGILGTPEKNSSGTLRLWIPSRPRELFYGTISAVTATSVTFGNGATLGQVVPDDDYYNGMFLVTTDGQVREVDDFTGSTKKFDVKTAWSSNPTASSSVVSLAAPISQYQALIPIGAAVLWRAAMDMPIMDLEAEYRKIEQSLLSLLSKQETHGSKMVLKISR